MTPITSIFIENIGNNMTPKSIAKLFADMKIAIVKQVTVFPEFDQNQKKNELWSIYCGRLVGYGNCV
jgi:hypothetical protein